MIESILHFIGICPDSLSHPNLLNLLTLGILVSIGAKLKFFYYKSRKIVKNLGF
jgi:hypothetical protein